MNTNTPNLPLPVGAVADDWQNDVPLPYRLLFGDLRTVDGLDVHLGDDGLTSAQARQLAAALLEAADEVDRWATK